VKIMDSLASGFASVDEATDAKSFVHYLELIHSLPFFQECKKLSYQSLDIHPGSTILEIGCGNGVDAWRLAELSGPTGQVIGADVSNTMLVSAKSVNRSRFCSPEFLMSDAAVLPFVSDSFDGVRTDRVLQHTRDPADVIREMTRILHSGGKIVVFEPDWDSFGIWPGDPEITRKVLNFWCDNIPAGWVGRAVYSAFAEAGLDEIEIKPIVLTLTDLNIANQVFDLGNTISKAGVSGIINPEQAERLHNDLYSAASSDRFFSTLTFYLATGTKP
jgi:ubiquinone/menaquinone biosynthesis C-methylase UbiE